MARVGIWHVPPASAYGSWKYNCQECKQRVKPAGWRLGPYLKSKRGLLAVVHHNGSRKKPADWEKYEFICERCLSYERLRSR